LNTGKKYLIFGSNGQLGTDLKQILQEKKIPFSAYDFPDGDITNPKLVTDIMHKEKPQIIINAAAYTAVDRAESEADMAFAVNAEGVKNLAHAAAGIPLIHISTDYVFPGDKEGAYFEQDETGPKSVYGSSKLQGERYLKEISDFFILIRTSWVYGLHGNNFVKIMIRLMNEREELKVVNDQFGSPTWSFDLARAIIDICEDSQKLDHVRNQTYHYRNDGDTTWFGFAEEIFLQLRKYNPQIKCRGVTGIKTEEYPTPAKRPANSVINIDSISTLLGSCPDHWKVSLEKFMSKLFHGDYS